MALLSPGHSHCGFKAVPQVVAVAIKGERMAGWQGGRGHTTHPWGLFKLWRVWVTITSQNDLKVFTLWKNTKGHTTLMFLTGNLWGVFLKISYFWISDRCLPFFLELINSLKSLISQNIEMDFNISAHPWILCMIQRVLCKWNTPPVCYH